MILDRDLSPSKVMSRSRLIRDDGIRFLAESGQLEDSDIVIPLAPLNVAAEYILRSLAGSVRTELPCEIKTSFRVSSVIDRFTFCVSYADFLCPDNCEEGYVCTVTGERRVPMFEKLRQIEVPGFRTFVIRSRQILPGVGGYTFQELTRLRDSISPNEKNIVCASCKCHAIMTGIEIMSRIDKPLHPNLTI